MTDVCFNHICHRYLCPSCKTNLNQNTAFSKRAASTSYYVCPAKVHPSLSPTPLWEPPVHPTTSTQQSPTQPSLFSHGEPPVRSTMPNQQNSTSPWKLKTPHFTPQMTVFMTPTVSCLLFSPFISHLLCFPWLFYLMSIHQTGSFPTSFVFRDYVLCRLLYATQQVVRRLWRVAWPGYRPWWYLTVSEYGMSQFN